MNILDYIPTDHKCTRLFVVGPYPMNSYVEKLRNDKRMSSERSIVVYYDESWKENEIKLLKKQGTVIPVCAENPYGLVHAKMYFLECEQNGNKKYVLIAGSGNASNNGMNNNAEVMAVVDVSSLDNYSNIVNYFYSFIQNDNCDKVPGFVIKLGDKHEIILPTLKKSKESSLSLYSWLRSGYLLYKYDRDLNFGYILVDLVKGLTGNKRFIELLEKHGFDTSGGTLQTLRHKYLNISNDVSKVKAKNEKGKIRNRLAVYGIETSFGYWVSKECFNEAYDMIFPKTNDVKLEELFSKVDEKKIANDLKSKLNTLQNHKEFKDLIDNKTVSRIDKIVKSKVSRDRSMSYDEEFANRYKSGFADHRMPGFDEDSFEEFCRSFFSTIVMKSKGRSVRNLLTQVIRKESIQSNICSDDKMLREWVIKNWDKVGSSFKNYYKNGLIFVKQKHDTDSGIACIAMLLGLTYEKVSECSDEIFGKDWHKESYEMDIQDIRTLISTLWEGSFGYFKKRKWKDCVDGRYLIALKGTEWRWIVAECNGGSVKIYDPSSEPRNNPDCRTYKIYSCLRMPLSD